MLAIPARCKSEPPRALPARRSPRSLSFLSNVLPFGCELPFAPVRSRWKADARNRIRAGDPFDRKEARHRRDKAWRQVDPPPYRCRQAFENPEWYLRGME